MYQVKVKCNDYCPYNNQVISESDYFASIMPTYNAKNMLVNSSRYGQLRVPIMCPHCGIRRIFVVCS